MKLRRYAKALLRQQDILLSLYKQRSEDLLKELDSYADQVISLQQACDSYKSRIAELELSLPSVANLRVSSSSQSDLAAIAPWRKFSK